MNIIRTSAVELSTIPAIAYKLKLASGGSGVKIFRLDQDSVAVFTIDKRGDLLPYGKVDEALFPESAVEEAMDMTTGMPYSARGKIKVSVFEQTKEPDDVTEEELEAIDMVNSNEYAAIVNRYSDEKGKLNYRLMNKDFIQFAAKSKTVMELVSKKADEDTILCHIIKNRAAYLANKKESLNDNEVKAIIETLDEIDPRSAFKELRSNIRRLLARK